MEPQTPIGTKRGADVVQQGRASSNAVLPPAIRIIPIHLRRVDRLSPARPEIGRYVVRQRHTGDLTCSKAVSTKFIATTKMLPWRFDVLLGHRLRSYSKFQFVG